MNECQIAVSKLYNREKLDKFNIRQLVCEAKKIDEIEGDEDRWTRHISSIIEIGNDLWCIEWKRGLTECQENEFWNQPYRVKRVEKEVIQKVVTYERVQSCED